MAVGDSFLIKVDTVLSDIFAGWSLSTTVLATLLFFFLAYPFLTWKDPDTHPFLLARQATASPTRQPGESAVYRSVEVPYGYPLRSGLNVKDPGAPKWSSGRDGDLRDIWILATKGPVKDDGSPASPKAKILTVLGRKKVAEHSLESITMEINVIGNYMQDAKSKRVAICLSNSIELLASIFAASFYGVHPILLPYGSSTDTLIQYVQKAKPDMLVAEAGTMEVHRVLSRCQSLKGVIWVTKAGNEHMAFAEPPGEGGGKVETSTWHDLIEEHKSATNSEIPPVEKDSSSPSLSIIEPFNGDLEVVEYTSGNIVAGIAALLNVLPRNQRFAPDDIVLPIAPLSASYPLTLTLAALFSHSTIALNSVAGNNVDFALAASGISPTVIIASSQSTLKYHDRLMQTQHGLLPKLSHYFQTKSLQNGTMPKTPSFAPPNQPNFLAKLRILFIYHPCAAAADPEPSPPRLSTTALHNLKILLGARTCYALTAPGVVGAICQTNVFDYRHTPANESHFGPPLSSVEVLLTGEEEQLGGSSPQGKVVVRGPAVCGGERKLGLLGRIGEDQTLSLL